MRVFLGVASLALAACGFEARGTADDMSGPGSDSGAGSDAAPSDTTRLDGCTTFSAYLDTCGLGAYGPPLTITGNKLFNTDTKVLSDDPSGNPTMPMTSSVLVGGAPVTVLVVEELTLTGTLRVVGSAAFGIASTGTVTIGGTIDATNGGAGARLDCGMSNGTKGTDGNDGSSGGGGGGFATPGAKGGFAHGLYAGGDGGVAAGQHPGGILGGCPGGKGGNDQNGGQGGNRGMGGGGVFVTSAASIKVVTGGVINVGGGGGAGGISLSGSGGGGGGGGGGGSGGLILLEAPSVSVSGALAANGGGGGGGAGNFGGGPGQVGQPSAAVANGGSAMGGGGQGGVGGRLSQPSPPQPANASGGSGGGGGGVGFISIKSASPLVLGIVSPALSSPP